MLGRNMPLRRNSVDRVITNLNLYLDQIHDENKQQLILAKLSETIQHIFDLLYGTMDHAIEPDSKTVHQLVSKLIDLNDNLFYKLAKYFGYFPFETQTLVSKILKCVIQTGSKHGIQTYIKSRTTSNGHNKIIDVLFKEFDRYPGATFTVLQAMTQRSDLSSMFLYKIRIKSPTFVMKTLAKATKHKAHHHTSQSLQQALKLNVKQNKKREVTHNKTTADGKKHTRTKSTHKPTKPKHCKRKSTADNAREVCFVEGLFLLIEWPQLQISLDAFKTLKYLFAAAATCDKMKDKRNRLSEYLYGHYAFIFKQFNTIINSDNALNKRQCFALLNEVLVDTNNFDVLMLYITQEKNLVIAKRILTNQFISSLTDEHQHNAIIDALLDDYFENAGGILREIASRRSLSDLLLNRTFITRIEGRQMMMNEAHEDIKYDDEPRMCNKNLQQFLGSSSIPHLFNVSSDKLQLSVNASNQGHITRYSFYSISTFLCNHPQKIF
eukprot:354719_1